MLLIQNRHTKQFGKLQSWALCHTVVQVFLYILSTTTKTGAIICNEFKSLGTGTSTQICDVRTISYKIHEAQP